MNQSNDSIGFLLANVKTANGALPIEGATVTIYGGSTLNQDGSPSFLRNNIIYTLKTDKNGKTEKVALSTKSKDLSLSPDNPIPYDSYNITVTADGFYDASYLGVPVFQGITSLQGANLIPLSEFASPNDYIPNSQRQYKESSMN